MLLSLKNTEWRRNKTKTLFTEKQLRVKFDQCQTAPCLADIQKILLLQKCEYVIYSQVAKQIQQGIHKGSWEAARCRRKYIIPLWYLHPGLFAGSWMMRKIASGALALFFSKTEGNEAAGQKPPSIFFNDILAAALKHILILFLTGIYQLIH